LWPSAFHVVNPATRIGLIPSRAACVMINSWLLSCGRRLGLPLPVRLLLVPLAALLVVPLVLVSGPFRNWTRHR
jgi:hypothetical protein